MSNLIEDAATIQSDIPRSKIYLDLYQRNKPVLDYIFKEKYQVSKIMETVRRVNGVGDSQDVMIRIDELEKQPLHQTAPIFILQKPFQA